MNAFWASEPKVQRSENFDAFMVFHSSGQGQVTRENSSLKRSSLVVSHHSSSFVHSEVEDSSSEWPDIGGRVKLSTTTPQMKHSCYSGVGVSYKPGRFKAHFVSFWLITKSEFLVDKRIAMPSGTIQG